MSIFYEFQDVLGNFKMCVFNIEGDYAQNSNIIVPENIKNPYKRIQYVAAREALLALDPEFPLDKVQLTETGKPYVPDYPNSFSLSHSSNYAAALISNSPNCGFDIELPGKKISSIRDKFISPSEYKSIEGAFRQFFPGASDFIFYGLCWSAKEAIYKWLSKRDLDFRNNMELFSSKNNFNTHIPFLNCRIKVEGEEEKVVSVFMHWQKPIVMTWVLGGLSSQDE